MSRRRLNVTATQAVSSMLATVTGAVAASKLGIAGTIIGAAFMSLASTVGAAVYKLYISRNNKRLRAAAATFGPRASASTATKAAVRRQQEQGGHQQATEPASGRWQAGRRQAG